MRRKKNAPTETPAAPLAPPSPPAYLFVWQEEEIDLRNFTEFRYGRNPDTGSVWAKFCGGGEKPVSVTSIAEAREIEASVNPYWGRR